MKSVILCVLLCAVLVTANSEVDNLQNFQEAINNGEYWFVKFFAPWCGHCKRMAPAWGQLASSDQLTERNVHTLSVDCTQKREICNTYAARPDGKMGFPTLILFGPDGFREQYVKTSRDVKSLTQFVLDHVPDDDIPDDVIVNAKGDKSMPVNEIRETMTELVMVGCEMDAKAKHLVLVCPMDPSVLFEALHDELHHRQENKFEYECSKMKQKYVRLTDLERMAGSTASIHATKEPAVLTLDMPRVTLNCLTMGACDV